MPRALAAFQDMSMPLTLGYTWRSSECSFVPNRSLTLIFPAGFIVVPFAALGVIPEGRRLSIWRRITSVPAAEMSAPESGSKSTLADPLSEETWMGIVGAGFVTVTFLTLGIWIEGIRREIALAYGCGSNYLFRQTFARWPSFWQWWHVRL